MAKITRRWLELELLQYLTGLQGITGIQGDTGIWGVTGLQGPTGTQGPQGDTGAIGETGLQGPTGHQGATGADGLQGITGLKGDVGSTGLPGANGSAGTQGTTGAKGDQGDQGIQGNTGLQGGVGPQGIQGNTGAIGQTGLPGYTGLQGITGPGVIGDMEVDRICGVEAYTPTGMSDTYMPITGLMNEVTLESPAHIASFFSAKFRNISSGSHTVSFLLNVAGETAPEMEEFQDNNSQHGRFSHHVTRLLPAGDHDIGVYWKVDSNTRQTYLSGGCLSTVVLEGALGPTGLQGPTGVEGSDGSPGVAGPTGAYGGPPGQTGLQGATGSSGATGPGLASFDKFRKILPLEQWKATNINPDNFGSAPVLKFVNNPGEKIETILSKQHEWNQISNMTLQVGTVLDSPISTGDELKFKLSYKGFNDGDNVNALGSLFTSTDSIVLPATPVAYDFHELQFNIVAANVRDYDYIYFKLEKQTGTPDVDTVGVCSTELDMSVSVGVGSTGFRGFTGEQGYTGSKGDQGDTGIIGIQGPTGAYGGPPGATGALGNTGAIGDQGETGFPGQQGETGDQGIQGFTGPDGWTGPEGPQGDQGDTGLQGTQGSQGPTGAYGGPPGATGIPGPTGFQGLTGPAGKGTTGIDGFTGPQGDTGIQGLTGPQGKGETGLTGVTGAKGDQGNTGLEGQQGETGVQGTQGNTGVIGLTGETGAKGVQGNQGNTGVQGVQGNQGDTGAIGQTGIPGPTGIEGPTGWQGVTGPQGKGETGLGFTGLQGPVGPQGQGVTGIQGATGVGAFTEQPVYNNVSLYQVVTTADEEVWVKSSSTVYSELTWSRATTTLTVNRTAHGHTTGDMVIVRNTNVDHQAAVITSAMTNSFTITTTNTGPTSGSGGAYTLGFTYAHDATGSAKTGGVLSAPTGDHADVQVLSVRIRTGQRAGNTYKVTVPASAVNGAGDNTSLADCYVPIVAVRQDVDNLSSVGATFRVNQAAAGYNVFLFGNIGNGSNSRFITMSF